MAEPIHNLSLSDIQRIFRAVLYVEKITREGYNAAPPAAPGLPRDSEAAAWPVEVTGSRISSPAEDAGLYHGKVHLPDPAVLPPWREEDCWVRETPGQTLEVGARGQGRLVGWREADGSYAARPVYALAVSGGGTQGVFGQAYSVPGEVVLWNDETGQWVKGAPGWRYSPQNTFGGRLVSQFTLTLPGAVTDFLFDLSPPHPNYHCVARDLGAQSQSFTPLSISLDYDWRFEFGHACGASTNFSSRRSHFNGTQLAFVSDEFRFLDNDVNAIIYTVPDSANSRVVMYHVSNSGETGVQYWMTHYSSNGTAGVSGTLHAGATATDGIITNLGTATSAYTVSNVTTDRSYDANATTLDELADVLGTLITDLKSKGILG